MANIMLTKFGGNTVLTKKEAYSSNAYLTDLPMIRSLVEAGHKFHVFNDCLKTYSKPAIKDQENKWREIQHESFIFHEEWPFDVPDFIDLIMCESGSENLRFTGNYDISKNLLIYRLLRSGKPFLYIANEVFTPFFPIPDILGEEIVIYGCTLPELIKSKCTILVGGRNKDQLIEDWYPLVKDYVDIITLEKEYHSSMWTVLKEYERPPKSGIDLLNDSVKLLNTEEFKSEYPQRLPLSFVGADRRRGSRSQWLYELSKSLDSRFFINVTGDWKRHTNTQNMIFSGKVRGVDKVLDAYNNSWGSLLIGNASFVKYKQLANRIWESVYSGSLPLVHYEWAPALEHLFPGNDRAYLEAVTWNTDTVNKILNNSLVPGIREKIISNWKRILEEQVPKDFILNQYDQLVKWMIQKPYRDPEVTTEAILQCRFEKESKMKRCGPEEANKRLLHRRLLHLSNYASEYINNNDMFKHFPFFACKKEDHDFIRPKFLR